MPEKTIVVVGATGTQGGGLARAILDDPDSEFAVRALTRNANSDEVRRLRDQGAEIVEADLDDPDTVVEAFDGAWGAFCVTFFWEHFSPDTEKAHARTMAEDAEAAGLEHVIWSTLEDTRNWIPLEDDRMPILEEEYKVPHFDVKGASDAFFEEAGVPTTFLLTSFYWDNLIHFGMGPRRMEDGSLGFVLPMGEAKLPGIAGEDIGKCAYGIFQLGPRRASKRIGISGENLTGVEMATGLSDALGLKIQYVDVPPEVYRSFDVPGAKDLGNMFQFKRDFNEDYCRPRDPERARALNPDLKSFAEWLADNKDRIPVEEQKLPTGM